MHEINFTKALQQGGPEFVSNNAEEGRKVISAIESELKRCESFFISVAFITAGGLSPLLMTLKELEAKQIPGRILTTNFLMFNDPKILDKLSQFKNIELRIFDVQESDVGFHTKGYGFHLQDEFTIIMGSSNMTLHALTRNKEWNVHYSSHKQESFVTSVLEEFESLWSASETKSYAEYIDTYRQLYKQYNEVNQKQVLHIEETRKSVYHEAQQSLQPNSMQSYVIEKFKQLYKSGANKGLLISATGTGKTYASAFAVSSVKPERVLFLVHREQVARQALESYRHVIGDAVTYGVLSGTAKGFSETYLFATMQMMAKPECYERFSPADFDVIVIDEAHRAGSESYHRIMDYFTPKFWFAMTASPERTDDFDIYKLFDYNIIHEIRLQHALESDLLCPFHYFGISQLSDGITTYEGDEAQSVFANEWDYKTRARLILEQCNFYGYSGERVKGLVFCHSIEEARALSDAFNELGMRTVSLSGADSQENREKAIQRLSGPHTNESLDYIMTVDIFNEGIDIPEVNQVVMVRGTESPIVFVQQLGRGLRRHNSKEYVVVLDFIGNFNNNFMIPVALSGDVSHNKDSLRYYVQEGTRVIPGASTIHFDAVAQERIFKSIDTAKFTQIKNIRQAYKQLKYKLGRIPSLADFENYGSIDILLIFNSSAKTYYKFLVDYEIEYTHRFSTVEVKILEYMGQYMVLGKRVHELYVLEGLLQGEADPLAYMRTQLERLDIPCTVHTERNIINLFTGQFKTGTSKASFKEAVLCREEGSSLRISDVFCEALQKEGFRNMIEDYVKVGFQRYEKYYKERYQEASFTLYQKYTYEDVCQLMEWETSIVPLNIGGYKYDEATKTYPVFINYDKGEDISDTIRYEDKLVSPHQLIAISKSGVDLTNNLVQKALHAREEGIAMHLFIRKNKNDEDGAKEFYYLGHIHATGETEVFTMPGTTKKAVRIAYKLDTPIREDLYDYFVNH